MRSYRNHLLKGGTSSRSWSIGVHSIPTYWERKAGWKGWRGWWMNMIWFRIGLCDKNEYNKDTKEETKTREGRKKRKKRRNNQKSNAGQFTLIHHHASLDARSGWTRFASTSLDCKYLWLTIVLTYRSSNLRSLLCFLPAVYFCMDGCISRISIKNRQHQSYVLLIPAN